MRTDLFENFSYHELLKMWRTLKAENMNIYVDQIHRKIPLNKLMDEHEKRVQDIRELNKDKQL